MSIIKHQEIFLQTTELPIEKVIYKELISVESLKDGLRITRNNASPGIDGESKQSISDGRIDKLHYELATQKYEPKPTKRVGILKPDGGTRYLGISSQIDKVVQGALLLKLQPILENLFIDESYGFRPERSCHSALKEIKYKWKAVTWIINADISKCFDKINHDFLLTKLQSYVDQATVELVRKFLKAGYVEIHNLNGSAEQQTEGTPQGSLISPILCNLYLHELDIYVKNVLCEENNKGKSRPKNPDYSKRYSLTPFDKEITNVYPQLKGALARVKHNKFVQGEKFSATDGFDPDYRRLHYVRYADDFILGFIGPYKEAENIMLALKDKLQSMKLDVNMEKSKIYHSSDLNIKYLGVYLRYFGHNKTVIRPEGSSADDVTKQVNNLKAQSINTVHFRVPVDKILKRLVDRGIAKKRSDNTVRGSAFLRICMLEDDKIVQRFSSIIRGLLNYYSCVNHKSDLWKVFACLRKSCALTLGHKHKINSAARVFAKYGPKLKIVDQIKKTETTLFYPVSLKTRLDFKTGNNSNIHPSILEKTIDEVRGSSKTNLRTADKCEYEGCDETTNIEAHHTNPMANLSKRKDLTTFEKVLIGRSRKTVTLCKKHHNLVHKKRLLIKNPETDTPKTDISS